MSSIPVIYTCELCDLRFYYIRRRALYIYIDSYNTDMDYIIILLDTLYTLIHKCVLK